MRIQLSLDSILAPPTFKLNDNGGAYQHGKPYSTEKKVDVANTYFDMKFSSCGPDPTPTNVAQEAKVGWSFAKKVIDEVEENYRVLSPEEIQAQRPMPLGVGSRCLTAEDEAYLEYLYYKKRYRTNEGYVRRLAEDRGKVVSASLIQKWWMQRRPFKCNFVEPNLTPIDKFRPENFARMVEYGDIVHRIDDKRRVHFIDESKVSGKDVYFRKVRKDPRNGSHPSIPVPGNFRDSYSMFASTSAWPDASHAVEAIWIEDNGDSFSTMFFFSYLLSVGHFRRGDIAVLDRWSGHFQGEASILEDFLWDAPGPDGAPMNILLVLLPARCPELNPIELVFHIIKERMRWGPYSVGILESALRATYSIDTEIIYKTMIHCGY
mmetsp:Transcript_1907/g.3767  ORF Transcript_1907/g.3767 Transcript_1907/m.3767 type:complete len:377 (-) Transcript_1907:1828-2958(-)